MDTENLNISNQNIAIAEAQYRQAKVLVEEAEASYFPTVLASASSVRQRGAINNNSGVQNSSSNSRPINVNAISLSASWEPDIWGSVRRSVEASKAGADVSLAQLAAVRLSMQASLAQYYFQVCNLDIDQIWLDKTVKAYETSLKLVKNLYASGVDSRLDILNMESQLETAKIQASENAITRAQYEHAIAMLIGRSPSTFSINKTSVISKSPVVPVIIPSTLLERRPDIAAAERSVAQANAEIGVATAAYFPLLSLTGSLGYQSNSFRHLISKPNQVWSLGPQLAQTLFDGGLRNAKLKFAKANYEMNVASYKQTVLNAFQNVEDNLVSLRILNSEVLAQNQVVANTEGSLNIVMNQYQAGTASQANILNAQISLYAAKKTAADLAGRRIVSTVNLITALGGGWH